ncbi:MAG: peptidoglycan-binding protein [Candidatus Peregrinibacteria bacterium]
MTNTVFLHRLSFFFAAISLLFSSSFLSLADDNTPPEGGKSQSLVVSAYYSPLPGQDAYVRGSYEGDIRLNGNGTNGADGTPVYPGMLAAPKSYAFGTRVYIPGLGLGTVHDRGGAIVEKDGYHRIDVWMGYGDEGRIRALQWGMRSVTGTVYADLEKEDSLALAIPHVPTPSVSTDNTSAKKTTGTDLFPQGMGIGQQSDAVKRLQIVLQDMGYLDADPTGYFGAQTQTALIAFQKDNGVIASSGEQGAGYFGPKTKNTLDKVLATRREKTENIDPPKTLAIAGGGKPKTERKMLAIQNPPKAPLGKSFSAPLAYGSRGDAVKAIQEQLIAKGYLEKGLNTGFYGEKTQKAVIAFQKDSQLAAAPTGIVEKSTYESIWS